MGKKLSLNQIIAKNLADLMARPDCPYPNANALGKAAKVAPNTVRSLLNPKQYRQTTVEKGEGYPTLDKLEKIAEKLGCEVWELIHPDLEQARREREAYQRLQELSRELQEKPVQDTHNKAPSRRTRAA